jgi:hypothetical protein
MTKPEIKFLEGPQSRWLELKFTVKVLLEFIKGFRALHFVGPCVTVFGSARFKKDTPIMKPPVHWQAKLPNWDLPS